MCAGGTRISVSRAVGDANMKRSSPPVLSCEADTRSIDLGSAAHKGKKWQVVMASDGVWFRMGNATVSSFLRRSRVAARGSAGNAATPSIAELLVRESFRRGSFDNISAICLQEILTQ